MNSPAGEQARWMWEQPPLRQAQGRLSAVRSGAARPALSLPVPPAEPSSFARLDSRGRLFLHKPFHKSI
jgi:hypothetical protein